METVLITGCSSGIGAATARAFLDAGWRVFATARNPDDIADLAAAGCETAALDVTDDGQVRAVVDDVLDAADGIDCLVNNAGYAQMGPLEDVPVDQLERQFDVNVFGPHRLHRAVLPGMRDRGTGTVVNVSSNLGLVSVPGAGAYAASKFALEAMSDALRVEVAPFGVDVVVVEPGPVETQFAERAQEELESGLDRREVYDHLYRLYADARDVFGTGPFASRPEDVAAVVLEAATDDDPEPRYEVGRLATLAAFARFVPESVRDRLLRLGMRVVS